jgi:hypothetical protein
MPRLVRSSARRNSSAEADDRVPTVARARGTPTLLVLLAPANIDDPHGLSEVTY